MRHRLSLVLLPFVVACAQDEERAPFLAPSGGVTNPITCDGLRSLRPAPNDAGTFWVSGGVAACAAEGQWCPVEWVQGCDAGSPFASCVGGTWVVSCQVTGEGGSADGGDA